MLINAQHMFKRSTIALSILANAASLHAQNLVFADGFGGDNYVNGTGVGHDGAGNAYICGVFNDTADFDPSGNTAYYAPQGTTSDAYVAKYSPTGALLWIIPIGQCEWSSLAEDIVVTDAGDVYVTGTSNITTDFDPAGAAFTLGTKAQFLAKYNSSGQFQWAFPITTEWQTNPYSLALAANGDVLVGGELDNPFDLDPSSAVATYGSNTGQVAMVARYNPSGTFVWAVTSGLGTNATTAYTRGICTDASGNIFLTGSYRGTIDLDPSANTANFVSAAPNITDVYLAKYDDAGTFVWGASAGDGVSDQWGIAVAAAPDGSVYLTGNFKGTMDMDPGAGTASIASTTYEGFLAKYDSNGACQWALNMTNSGVTAASNAVGVAANGDVFATGYTTFYAHFNPADQSQVWNTHSFSGDGYVVSYTPSGNLAGAFLFGAAYSEVGQDIDMLATGEFMITGDFFGADVDFDPGAGTAFLSGHQAFAVDCFLARYNGIPGIVGVGEVVAMPHIALYPEPSNGTFTLAVDKALVGARYTITDISGRSFAQGTLEASQTEHRFNVPSGAYLIVLNNDGTRVSRRLTIVR